MGRKILAVVLGVITGFILVFIGDATTHKLHDGGDITDKDAMGDYIASIPMYVMVIMVLFWLIAAFLGGMVAGKVDKIHWKQVSLITGGILLAATILNLAMFPHPAWMWIVAVALILPAAYFGGRLAAPKAAPLV